MKTLPALLAALCALPFTVSSKAATNVISGTVNTINGPASPGLDLAGEMTHVINFSLNDGPRFVNGVKFTPDTALAPGLTVGPNNVTPWQVKPNFGTGPDIDNLEEIYHDIRWADNNSPTQKTVQAHLPVTAGETYKVQILFYGNQIEDRRWDIEIEGTLTVDEISSLGVTTGGSPGTVPAYSPTTGLVYAHTVTVTDGTLDIRMGTIGGAFDTSPDRNPIWQALIVEHVLPDLEPDGLPDAYEVATFGGTGGQTGADDSDGDGLTNQFEYQYGSNPMGDTDNDGLADGAEFYTHGTSVFLADTDGDGLNDGPEITAATNPVIADTDIDGLSDGAEVNTHGTNPLDRDSDNDDYLDGNEVTAGTNPKNAAVYPFYSTQLVAVTGGDQGEGLDFAGNIIAAARFGITTISGTWPVRDASFRPYHSVPGLTHNSTFQADAWTTMAFPGPLTAADTSLATVMRSIRYQTNIFNIALSGLTVGRSYKLQLIFAEQCCANRGFDIYVENALVADEFSPPAVQGGFSPTPSRGAAVIYGFVATDTILNIRLDKTTVSTPTLNDPNPILSALSVEEIPAGADLDADGLPDQWEIDNFKNTKAETGDGDPDHDGLTNIEELNNATKPKDADTDDDGISDGVEVHTAGTSPRTADTDGDGLADGIEINTQHTDPLKPDTDRDTLLDGAEVNIHGSNPLLFDSDNDGFSDPTEVLNNTVPTNAGSKPGGTHVSRVFGPDAGEGLDLFGNFLYAFNVGSPGAAGQIHDANFTADTNVPGLSLTAPNDVPVWFTADFGNSTAENNLEFIYRSLRYADAAAATNHVTVQLANLTPGRQYKLQLMFVESCCDFRYFDVSVNGVLLADEFNVAATQGSLANNFAAAAIVHTFTATGTTVTISLDGTTTQAGTDHNATLSGLTLEEVVNVIPLEVTGVTKLAAGFKIDIRGTANYGYSVDWSPDLTTWEEVNDALVPNVSGDGTWTDTNTTRVGPLIPRGFYKVRDPAVNPTP